MITQPDGKHEDNLRMVVTILIATTDNAAR